jgi:hypothetical protein
MTLVDDAMISDVAPPINATIAFVGPAQIVATWLHFPSLSLSLQIILPIVRKKYCHLWFPVLEDLHNNDVHPTNVENLTQRNFVQ